MNRRADFRSFIACAVAYAIAIQAALLGLTVATAASSTIAAILCSDQTQADGPFAPANQGHGADMLCCVAAGCAGSAGLLVDRVAVGPAEAFAATRDRPIIPSDEFTGWPSERPKSSRAPPV